MSMVLRNWLIFRGELFTFPFESRKRGSNSVKNELDNNA